jgi:hypothetical protein
MRRQGAHDRTRSRSLLIERIARFYVDMRVREETGEINRSSAIKEQKEFNSFWLSMTVEFNKQLLNSQEKLRDALCSRSRDPLQPAAARHQRRHRAEGSPACAAGRLLQAAGSEPWSDRLADFLC